MAAASKSTWRFVLLLVGLTLGLHAALLPRFASAIASDLGDPLLNIWIFWWNVFHVPLTDSYWNAPAFTPAPNALALSETLLGLTWMTSPLQWLGSSPVTAYNAAGVAVTIIAIAIVLDGWVVVPVVDLPAPMPPTVADLVIELPRYSPYGDAQAMYHGMSRDRPVMNGYSEYEPSHYRYIVDDLQVFCLDSLDDARGGRSLDIVVWPDNWDAAALDDALRARWGATREERMGAIVYHLPRTAASTRSEYLWLSSRLAMLSSMRGCKAPE